MPVQDQKYSFILQELARRSEDGTKRLRDIEQRLSTLESRFSVMEELDIDRNKKNDRMFEELSGRIGSMNDDIIKIKMMVEKLTKQSDKFARKSELREIETVLGITKPGLLKEDAEL